MSEKISGFLRDTFKEKQFLIFDFETENLNLRHNKPWQLFFLITQGETIIKQEKHYLKWTNLDVSKDAARITHFNPKTIEEFGKNPKTVLDVFDSYLYDEKYCIVGQNIIGFDAFVHNGWRLEFGKKTDYSWLNRLYDTNCLAKAYKLGLKKKEDESLLNWQFRLNNIRKKGLKTNLSALGKEFNLPFDELNLHDASVDVPLCFEIFKQLIWRVEI